MAVEVTRLVEEDTAVVTEDVDADTRHISFLLQHSGKVNRALGGARKAYDR